MPQPGLTLTNQARHRALRERCRHNEESISRLSRWMRLSRRLCFLTFFAGIAASAVGWHLSDLQQKRQNTIRIANTGLFGSALLGMINLSLLSKKRMLRWENRSIRSNLAYWDTMTTEQKTAFYDQITIKRSFPFLMELIKKSSKNRS
ncbi:MAG: hypothetical protein IJV07_01800 [Alphaproteobacteria bacterium]|nr:hypothetical protein [Alphaproteobacteria bacterium]